ncbi:MAG: pyocin knob domain-containing protein [Tannerellaceae bacterium]|nr:pyocin knob domain-containing protein [Tannerellaceae bacterium]
MDILASKEELSPLREKLDGVADGLFNLSGKVEEEYATKEEVQEKIDLVGRVFRLRGTVEKEEDLEAIENPVDGDVVLVRIDSNDEFNQFKGYVYIREEEKWELIGSTSLDDIYTKEEINKLIEDYAKLSDTRDLMTTGSIHADKNITTGTYLSANNKTGPADGLSGSFLNINGLFIANSEKDAAKKGVRWLYIANEGTYTSSILEENTNELTYVATAGHKFKGSIFSNSSIFTSGKTSSNDGMPGVALDRVGGVEIVATNPYIDFHSDNSTADFTTRIIEVADEPGVLRLQASNGINTTGVLTATGGLRWDAENIPANADLNDYTIPGIYKCTMNVTAKTLTNSPIEKAFSMIILQGPTNATTCNQFLVTYENNNTQQMWQRNAYSGDWGNWKRIPYANETPQFGTYTNLPSVGGTHNLSDYNYDCRFNLAITSTATVYPVFTGGTDGMEYIFTINNPTNYALTISFPTDGSCKIYPETTKSIVCKAGRATQIFIKYVFGKYLIRV